MNTEQIKSGVRWVVATFGGMVAGFFAGKGWVSSETVMQILTSETFIGIVASAAALVWGMFTHTQQNAVAVVGKIASDPESPVRGVITENTKEGKELAASIPEGVVAHKGSVEAKAVAGGV
jgi:hypothetical protein